MPEQISHFCFQVSHVLHLPSSYNAKPEESLQTDGHRQLTPGCLRRHVGSAAITISNVMSCHNCSTLSPTYDSQLSANFFTQAEVNQPPATKCDQQPQPNFQSGYGMLELITVPSQTTPAFVAHEGKVNLRLNFPLVLILINLIFSTCCSKNLGMP